MTISFHDDRVPLRLDDTGTIRVGKTRVTLDVLLRDYQNGLSPEEIVRQLDTLTLADVYGAIAYYLRHRDEVDEYLRQREELAEQMRRLVEANQKPHPTREELLARLARRNGGNAPTAQ